MDIVGRSHSLIVAQIDLHGAWLQAGLQKVLLPKREVPEGLKAGAQLTVFVYGSVGDQLQGTLRTPRAEVGEIALFPVSQVTEHGVFVDWGIGKELLVPFAKQPERMQSGRSYLVRVELDRQGRPFGNARFERALSETAKGLKVGQEVSLLLWQFTDLGAKVIVEQRTIGLLYRNELRPELSIGTPLVGYVKALRPDGKLDVTLRPGGANEVEEAKAKILAALAKTGTLPLHDQSPPAAIQGALGMSKKLFKKAVGGLYKAGLVELTPDGVRRKGR